MKKLTKETPFRYNRFRRLTLDSPLKGKSFWFNHRFMGRFMATLHQRHIGEDITVKLSTDIKYNHYSYTAGSLLLVNMGNIVKLQIA
jgi:hypothetical protein